MSAASAEHGSDGGLRLTGELDAASVPGLLKNAADWFGNASAAEVSVDLSGVERADSAGVAFLLEIQRRARAAQRGVRFRGAPAQIRSIVEFCALDRVLEID